YNETGRLSSLSRRWRLPRKQRKRAKIGLLKAVPEQEDIFAQRGQMNFYLQEEEAMGIVFRRVPVTQDTQLLPSERWQRMLRNALAIFVGMVQHLSEHISELLKKPEAWGNLERFCRRIRFIVR
ncbi:MAG: hypothetical protein N2049_03465, partial [Anaerolineales bacterium]|nr:hypothetical protein [Anaerolineales bacterium]